MKKKLLTKSLKEAFEQHPLDSSTGKLEDLLCLQVFCVGPIRWYIIEGSQCGTNDYQMFVIVSNWIEDELGYVRLQELQDLTVNPMIFLLTRPYHNGMMQAMPLPGFKPCPLKDIKGDARLAALLSKYQK